MESDIREAIFEAFEALKARNELKEFIKAELMKAINDAEFESKINRDEKGRFASKESGDKITTKETKQKKIDSVNIDFTKDNVLPSLNIEDLIEIDNLLKKQGIKQTESDKNKKVIFKKESIEYNQQRHPDILPTEYNRLVAQALYNRTYIIPGNKEGHFVFYGKVDLKHYSDVAIDINDTPESYAITHVHVVRKREAEKKGKNK